MEKGQGFEYRWKDWPFTGGRKGIGADTILFNIWWQEIEEFSYDGYFSVKQEARLSTENEWTVGEVDEGFDKSIAGLRYCWGGRVRLVIMNFLGTNLPK